MKSTYLFDMPKVDKCKLGQISSGERTWLDSLNNPFSSHHVTDDGLYEVFMLDYNHHHLDFNPFCSMILYLQQTHIGEKEDRYNTRNGKIYYVHQPMFKPTGTISVDHGSRTMTCLDGYLHNSSGDPAMSSDIFGPAYYLHGTNYEPLEYFKLMEDQRKHRPQWFHNSYSDYNPAKYIDFMANILGGKNKTI